MNKTRYPLNPRLDDQYFTLLKKALTRYDFDDGYLSLRLRTHGPLKGLIYTVLETLLNPFNLELAIPLSR